MVSPAARVTQPLCLEQVCLAPPEPLFRFLAGIDVGEQVVPADDAAVGISQRKPTRLKPPVFAIKPSDPVLEFVRISRFDSVLPGNVHAWEIGRVNGVRRAPSPELLKGPAEILEYLAVHVLDLTGRRHHGHEAGNRLDDEAKTLLTHIMHCRSAGETREISRAGRERS